MTRNPVTPTRVLKLEAVVVAARKIRHWHDAMRDNSGMVVSANAVRELWAALDELDGRPAVTPTPGA